MKGLASVASLCALVSIASAQGWTPTPLPDQVGLNGNLAAAPDGELYLSCFDGGVARVRRWTGAAWEERGAPSCGASWQGSLFFDAAATPYYVSRDYEAPGAFDVRRLVGGGWEALTACNPSVHYKPTLVASIHDPAGVVVLGTGLPGEGFLGPTDAGRTLAPTSVVTTPVVLVNDGIPPGDPSYPSTPPELQNEHATVVYWRDGAWRYLGPRRFSEFPSAYLDLHAWGGALWVGYAENTPGARFSLKRYDGARDAWPTVATLVGVPTKHTTLCDAYGALVVLAVSNGELRAWALAGDQLAPVGGVIEGGVHMGQQDWIQRVSAGKDADGRLYVACRRTDGRFSIHRLSVNPQGAPAWTHFADSPAALGPVRFVTMDVAAWDDRVWVAYSDVNDRLKAGYFELRD